MLTFKEGNTSPKLIHEGFIEAYKALQFLSTVDAIVLWEISRRLEGQANECQP